MPHDSLKNSCNDDEFIKIHKKHENGRKSAKSTMILAAFLAAVILAAGVIVTARFRSSVRLSASDRAAAQSASLASPADAKGTATETSSGSVISSPEPKAQEESENAEAEAPEAEAEEYSVYQKLENGIGINILVLGDESAADAEADAVEGIVDGTKFKGLSDYLEDKYLSNSGAGVSVTNLAYQGGSLLADALRVITMPEEPSYDLIILSYGMNDHLDYGPNYFGSVQPNTDLWLDYATLLLKLNTKFPDASIICTLEPCFHKITEELNGMKQISEQYYAIPVADLCSALLEKDESEYYDYFEADQTLPNAKGVELWIKLLCDIIDEKVDESEGKMSQIYCGYYKAEQIGSMSYIPASDPCVTRKDDTSYTVNFKADGMAYIHHERELQAGDAKAIADDMLYNLHNTPNGAALPDGSHVTLLHDSLQCQDSFELIFPSKELADELKGFYLVGSK